MPIAIAMLVFLLAAIRKDVVSPFGGSTTDVGRQQQQHRRSMTSSKTKTTTVSAAGTTTNIAASKSPLFRNTSTNSISTTRHSIATLQAAASTTITTRAEGMESSQKSSIFRRILRNANPLARRKDDHWKGGETTATFASRLLFSYVSPLLDIVSDNNDAKDCNRTLTEEDAFDLAKGSRSMDQAVDALAGTYDRSRIKARRHLEEKRQKQQEQEHNDNKKGSGSNNEVIKNSQSFILMKALVRDQKSSLVFTGVLRLLNTAIQAFPSILVARFLRSIEMGNTIPVSQSLKAAVLLVFVLGVKMIAENQYFHYVVNMSTQVRGTLEGLIFDKSLRLPEGGSGVLAKQGGSYGKNKKQNAKKALGSGGVSKPNETLSIQTQARTLMFSNVNFFLILSLGIEFDAERCRSCRSSRNATAHFLGWSVTNR